MTKFYEVLSNSRYLAKQNRGVKSLELIQISPTLQDVICVDRDADLEVRNVLYERSKRLPGSSQDSPKNFTVKKLLQAKNRTLPGRFLNRSRRLISSYWVGNFGHVSIEVDWVIGREWICQCLASCNGQNSPANKAVCMVCVVCVVCSLHYSLAVVAWMRVKAVYAVWNGFSANGFWIHSLAGP